MSLLARLRGLLGGRRPPSAPAPPDRAALERKIDAVARELRLDEPTRWVPTDAPPADLPSDDGSLTLMDATRVVQSLEIGTSALPQAVEEAAMLFAAGKAEASLGVLTPAFEDLSLGAWRRHAWRMGLDALQYAGRREAFDAMAMQYAQRFETSPPAWRDEAVADAAAGATPRRGVLALRLTLAPLPEARSLPVPTGEATRPVLIDATPVEAIDARAAAGLVALVAGLEDAGRPFGVRAPERLLAAARAALQTGRRDEDDGAWQLLLLAWRLLDDQAAFEEASIDYCITYEISPPPWAPMPAAYRRDDATEAADDDGVSVQVTVAGAGRLQLSGELQGEPTELLEALDAQAEMHAHLVLDCERLQRLDFMAASQLYNALARLRARDRSLELRGTSHVVAALLALLGVPEVATVVPRAN